MKTTKNSISECLQRFLSLKAYERKATELGTTAIFFAFDNQCSRRIYLMAYEKFSYIKVYFGTRKLEWVHLKTLTRITVAIEYSNLEGISIREI